MTLFFPDLNVWLALSDQAHVHSREAWSWLSQQREARLIFSRYTHLGLLRLLTNPTVMANEALTLRQAWDLYDEWRTDPRVDFFPEPSNMESAFRSATAQFGNKPAPKWVGDCYLIAYARECQATVVTFDKALLQAARKSGCSAILPS